jgi:CMP-N-acetylneuraminic acid synthetase
MRIAAWMPLKRDSRRLEGKNFQTLGDIPLCHHMGWTMRRLEILGSVHTATVLSSDEGLRDMIPWLRWHRFDAGPDATASDMAKSAAKVIDADLYVCLFATSPFLKLATIRQCISAVQNGASAAVTCRRMSALAWIDGEPNYDLMNVKPTDKAAAIDVIVSGCIAYTRESLDRTGMMIPRDALFVPVEWPEWIDIDSAEDLKMAESYAKDKH